MLTQYSGSERNLIFSFLKFSAFTVLLGRAYHYFFFDIPLSAFFWNQGLLEGFVNSWLNMSWDEYAKSSISEAVLIYPRYIVAFLYLITAVFTIYKKDKKQKADILLLLSSLGLITLAMLYFIDLFSVQGQFIEYSLQFSAPLFLYLFSRNILRKGVLKNALKLAVSLTFIGHGLYAFGFYPVPVKFMEMTMTMLPFDESTATLFLRTAGFLDFLVAIGIYWNKTEKPLLLYATIWGLFTAMARVMVYFDPHFALESLHQYWWQTFFRMPHMLVPLLLYLWAGKSKAAA